jgi:hypothetical protein
MGEQNKCRGYRIGIAISATCAHGKDTNFPPILNKRVNLSLSVKERKGS